MWFCRSHIRSKHWSSTRLPMSKKVLFKPNTDKLEQIKASREARKPVQPIYAKIEQKIGLRYNALDIPMIPKCIHEQVFKNYVIPKAPINLIETCRKELLKHGMVNEAPELVDDINLHLPPLEGENLEQHFMNIGLQQAKPYLDLVNKILPYIPPKPTTWEFEEGWTRYAPNEQPTKVDYPLENDLVFDVEVCMNAGKAPTMATAVSSKAWYGWVSKSLMEGSSKPVTKHQYREDVLIPLETNVDQADYKLTEHMKLPKIVIGHNVSYDRARIKEQYWPERTGLRFLDTMSLHVCVSGITSYQRAVLKSKDESDSEEDWKAFGSLNSLSETYKLYCNKTITKETRDLFVVGTLYDIQKEFQNVMNYCANDVNVTWELLTKLFPLYTERFPHPVTFAGMLELSTAYLPVNSNWDRYINESESTYDDLEIESKALLAKRADNACQLLHDDKYKEDLWMWDQDWEVKSIKLKKVSAKSEKSVFDELPKKVDFKEDEPDIDPIDLKFKYLENLDNLSVGNFLCGYPNWYRKLCLRPNVDDWEPGPQVISTSMKITPKLLNLTWEGYPLHYEKGLGWGFLVPFSADFENKTVPIEALLKKCPLQTVKSNVSNADTDIRQAVAENLSRKEYYSAAKQDKSGGVYSGTGVWCNRIIEDCIFFFKLPHKDGPSHRVGNPLAKDFLNKFSENVLSGDNETAEQVMEIARKLSYWRNNRDRITGQMVVWLNNENNDFAGNYGAIIPQVVVCGTLTRRAVEPTWMTASNAHVERIGSELRAMIQAPAGYKIVGADVDSQELWIASVIGDANHAKMHGATPLGWMTLSGSKTNSTDMHSVTAKAIGISRDHSKVLNYARIYGAGQNFAERLLKQFNPTLSENEARSKAQKMFNLTKGKRFYRLRQEFIEDFADVPYNKWQAIEFAKAHGKTLNEMFHNARWVGGTESAMFNSLEDIATRQSPVTPFLNCRLSRALEPKYCADEKFLPTRINWVVQSGAVDFLHLMLVCMRWLMKDKARFCLSFHDEIRYLVDEKYQYKAALAMHITNLLTRSFCSARLGIYDLPNSCAFFSSVEIDSVLRKESHLECRTPSNPFGLEKGYGISNGESVDIRKAIEKADGTTNDWYNI